MNENQSKEVVCMKCDVDVHIHPYWGFFFVQLQLHRQSPIVSRMVVLWRLCSGIIDPSTHSTLCSTAFQIVLGDQCLLCFRFHLLGHCAVHSSHNQRHAFHSILRCSCGERGVYRPFRLSLVPPGEDFPRPGNILVSSGWGYAV